MPIRLRMTVLYAGLLTLVVAAVGAFVVVRLRSDLTTGIDRNLGPAAHQIAVGYEREGVQEFRDSSASLLAGERAVTQVLARDGSLVEQWGSAAGTTPLLSGGALRSALTRPLRPTTLKPDRGARLRVAARPATSRGVRQVVVTAVAMAPVDRSVRRVLILLLLALPVALALTAAGAWWLAGRALRPIREMTGTAAALDTRALDTRVAHPGTRDEVGELATTLNAMLDRVETAVAEQQRLVADTSHELRTPLAAMRSEIDVCLRLDQLSPASREVLESVRDEVDALANTVANLLALARLDAGEMAAHREPVDLREVAAEVARLIEPLADARHVSLQVQGEPTCVLADAGAVRHVVRNLVENAVEFSPQGATVELETAAADGVGRLSVLDSGPGLPPGARERIFDRFYRDDSSRSRRTGGSGLGLAIARELVEAHGGRLWFEDRDGGGSAFTVELKRHS